MPTLNWIGKDKVQKHPDEVPYRVLNHQYTYPTNGNQESVNKIIHGDNLEALKALLPEYEGKVDCIYIDPPYNTGNEGWVYNDNVNDPHIRKWLNQTVGKEAEDLTRHDKWLCMMYPRLVLLQRLLAPTGVIFISIDDNEQANLKLICDEIFGAGNFQGHIHWRRRNNQPNDKTKLIGLVTEHILVYSRNAQKLKEAGVGKIPLTGSFSNPDNDERGAWASKPMKAAKGQGGSIYSIELPDGRHIQTVWLSEEKTYRNLLNDGRIYFPINKGKYGYPRIKYYKSEREEEGQCANNWWSNDFAGCNQDAADELKNIFSEFTNEQKVFDTPKPVRLLELIINLGNRKNGIFLDSFAGSGTTAHAVLNLNKRDGGHRRFILVEMCDYAETITAERVRRVIDGYGEGNKAVEGTGGSFSYYELGETIYDPQSGLLNDNADIEHIRRYIWYSETTTPYQLPTTAQHPYLLGQKDNTRYYFYYRRGKETVLDRTFLSTFTLADKAEQYIIYADCCRLSKDFLLAHHILFKQIPRDIKKV